MKQKEKPQTITLFGKHAVFAALANPKREKNTLFCDEKTFDQITPLINKFNLHNLRTISKNKRQLDELSNQNRHQGLALTCKPLEQPTLESIVKDQTCKVIIIDQINDSRNLGAVMRAAYLAGYNAVIAPKRHSPSESGSLAQAAAGALETIPLIKITNVAQTLRKLEKYNFTTLALNNNPEHGTSETIPNNNTYPQPLALVMGSENKGLRQLTKTLVQQSITIDMPGMYAENINAEGVNVNSNPFRPDSHNLAQSAALAMYLIKTT